VILEVEEKAKRNNGTQDKDDPDGKIAWIAVEFPRREQGYLLGARFGIRCCDSFMLAYV
jgi:hypothetical protein